MHLGSFLENQTFMFSYSLHEILIVFIIKYQILFCYKTGCAPSRMTIKSVLPNFAGNEVLPFLHNPKDLDFWDCYLWDCFGRKHTMSYNPRKKVSATAFRRSNFASLHFYLPFHSGANHI